MGIQLTIAPTWDEVQKVIDRATEALTRMNVDADVISATTMCVSELAENAIKYGAQTPDHRDIELNLDLTEDVVQVRVINGVKSSDHLALACRTIEQIRASDDHMGLYIGRLREMLNSSHAGASQLGLYRIAYEGQFELDYNSNAGVFEVIATRRIS